ncbi:unnamed protein product, partial [Heligmosomoides polygyrus]|uniref:SnoaL-like domain-containing protein n=1 Tax=Heligmosomoides polygyrus TaxID=6339 RepID=A0A183FNJ4_HELPZ
IFSRNLVPCASGRPVASGHYLKYCWGPEKAAGTKLVVFRMLEDHFCSEHLDYWLIEDDIIAPIMKKEHNDWKSFSQGHAAAAPVPLQAGVGEVRGTVRILQGD